MISLSYMLFYKCSVAVLANCKVYFAQESIIIASYQLNGLIQCSKDFLRM